MDADDSIAAASEDAAGAAARRRRSVLIVDDDRWTTKAVAAVLGECDDLAVLPPCHTGEAAVAAFCIHQPDVVLMDLNLGPGISGVDAIARIVREDRHACIIVLTTVSPGPGIARALEAGAIAAVGKSGAETQLVDLVRSAEPDLDPAQLRTLVSDIVISGDRLPSSPAISPQLTGQETAVLRQICEGRGYHEIAGELCIEVTTVKTHARSLRSKLYARSLAQLIVRALQFKFYTPP